MGVPYSHISPEEAEKNKSSICDYCNRFINRDIEPIVETRITYTDSVPSHLVEVAHKECWTAINTVVNTIIEYSRNMLTRKVERK